MADAFPFSQERYLLIGKVAKPHGLRGEVKVQTFSDAPETILAYSQVTLVDNNGRLSPLLKLEKSRIQGKVAVVKLEKVDDRNGAEAIQGRGVLLEKKDLAPVADGEYYWYQLYNLLVYTDTGKKIGRVNTIFSNGAQDVMLVKDRHREYLIPIHDAIIKEHNKEEIIITPPPGLLDINTGTNE